jgi:hypothetical protein
MWIDEANPPEVPYLPSMPPVTGPTYSPHLLTSLLQLTLCVMHSNAHIGSLCHAAQSPPHRPTGLATAPPAASTCRITHGGHQWPPPPAHMWVGPFTMAVHSRCVCKDFIHSTAGSMIFASRTASFNSTTIVGRYKRTNG